MYLNALTYVISTLGSGGGNVFRLQTLLGHFAFQEIITAGRLEGIVLILGGSTIYKAKATIPLTLRDIDDDEDPYTAAVDSKDVLPKA